MNTVMEPIELPMEQRVRGFDSFPIVVKYRNRTALPPGMVLNEKTGALEGEPVYVRFGSQYTDLRHHISFCIR